jgi:putative transposase
VRHFDLPGHVHELTFSTYRRQPALLAGDVTELVLEAIDRAHTRHGYALHAYVVMPEHVHLLVRPLDHASPIAKLLQAIKTPASARARRLFEDRRDPWLDRLRINVKGKPTY